jgi:hypothetical protein
VVLPGIDGIEMIHRARRVTPGLRAVLFSGHLNHLPLLEKPFAPEALAAAIEFAKSAGISSDMLPRQR